MFLEGREKNNVVMDGDTTLRKVSTAVEFIWSDTPFDILGSVTSISFDDPTSLPIEDHALTTEEIKILYDDLCVLGKQDFKHLLKWWIHIRKALTPSQKAKATTTKNVEKEENEEQEDKILHEMEELTHAMELKKKQVKKLLAKRQAKICSHHTQENRQRTMINSERRRMRPLSFQQSEEQQQTLHKTPITNSEFGEDQNGNCNNLDDDGFLVALLFILSFSVVSAIFFKAYRRRHNHTYSYFPSNL